MAQYKAMYSVETASTPNWKLESLAIKKRFFYELDSLVLVWSEGIVSMVIELKELYTKHPVLAINKFLSSIQDDTARKHIRNNIYNIH